MTRLAAFCIPILLALPLTASAEPLAITTRTTGLADPNAIVLGHLDIDDYDFYQGPPLPYEMTVRSVFDPDEPGIVPDAWGRATDMSTDVSVTFRIGDTVFSYSGEGRSTVQATAAGNYFHDVGFRFGSYVLSLANTLQAPPGTLGPDAFAPLEIDSGDGLDGGMRIDTYPANPDAPGFWSMSAPGQFASLQVISAVPEPAPLAMLATGLLGIGLGLRRRRTAHR